MPFLEERHLNKCYVIWNENNEEEEEEVYKPIYGEDKAKNLEFFLEWREIFRSIKNNIEQIIIKEENLEKMLAIKSLDDNLSSLSIIDQDFPLQLETFLAKKFHSTSYSKKL